MSGLDALVSDGRIGIRRMRDEDADFVRMAGWLNQPHVKYFWDPDLPAATPETVRQEFAADIRPDASNTPCVVEFQGRPVGFIQFYRWSAYPDEVRRLELEPDVSEDTWGIDVFIGEPALVGVGVGSRVVELLCEHLEVERGASSILLLTEIENRRAQRAYEKAGFVRIREQLDLDTRDGVRVRSFVMVRRPRSIH